MVTYGECQAGARLFQQMLHDSGPPKMLLYASFFGYILGLSSLPQAELTSELHLVSHRPLQVSELHLVSHRPLQVMDVPNYNPLFDYTEFRTEFRTSFVQVSGRSLIN